MSLTDVLIGLCSLYNGIIGVVWTLSVYRQAKHEEDRSAHSTLDGRWFSWKMVAAAREAALAAFFLLIGVFVLLQVYDARAYLGTLAVLCIVKTYVLHRWQQLDFSVELRPRAPGR